jgi:tetratricopeptide (TPR) repeat protein
MQKDEEKEGIGESINNFIQKNRRPIYIGLLTIGVLLIGTVITLFVIEQKEKKALIALEEYTARYEQVRDFLADDAFDGEVTSLLADLQAFANKALGFSKGKAWTIIAGIYSARNDWVLAEDAWRAAANASPKSYLGPVAYYNAAVAAEEQGKYSEAIELFTMSVTRKMDFPAAPHAQFSIGRLNETLNDKAAAIEAYRQILTKWPSLPVWADLAQSRIIYLETF